MTQRNLLRARLMRGATQKVVSNLARSLLQIPPGGTAAGANRNRLANQGESQALAQVSDKDPVRLGLLPAQAVVQVSRAQSYSEGGGQLKKAQQQGR